jgi:hypothetical protein
MINRYTYDRKCNNNMTEVTLGTKIEKHKKGHICGNRKKTQK